MATTQQTADFITEQTAAAGDVYSRKMFGEYALYCDNKVVALICDEQLFIKPTEPGHDFMAQLVRLTADALPVPKPKRKRA